MPGVRTAPGYCRAEVCPLSPQYRRATGVLPENALAPANTCPPSACHCKTRPCTRSHAATFCMSLRGAGRLHRDVAIRFPRREAWQVGCCLGKFVTPYVCALSAVILLCPTAGEADCHVASLLAMTCCNMHLPAWQGRFPSGKFVALFRIPQASPPCPCEHLASFCMSLRTSAHTGVAIRVPAGKANKLAILWANS